MEDPWEDESIAFQFVHTLVPKKVVMITKFQVWKQVSRAVKELTVAWHCLVSQKVYNIAGDTMAYCLNIVYKKLTYHAVDINAKI